MSETLGYIVIGKHGAASLATYCDTMPRAGVLMFGGGATVFPTRRGAQRAIERTMRYATVQGYTWHEGARFEVVTLERPRETRRGG